MREKGCPLGSQITSFSAFFLLKVTIHPLITSALSGLFLLFFKFPTPLPLLPVAAKTLTTHAPDVC